MTTTPQTTPATIAESICKAVAELDDRDSPVDWPEAMLVTSDELHQIVTDALAPSTPATTLPKDIQSLLTRWEARALTAFPADAMLINKCIRELREIA